MEHYVHPVACFPANAQVSYVCRDQAKTSADASTLQSLVDILGVTRREVVEAYHRLPKREKAFEQVRSDEARNPGYEPGPRVSPQGYQRGLIVVHFPDITRRKTRSVLYGI